MKLIYWFIIAFSILTTSVGAQTIFNLEIDQAIQLKINAGEDTIMCVGREISLGGIPTATGGTGQLFYSWFPSENLDDPTSPNPVATITEATVFTLIVMDENGCLTQDFVTIEADFCLGVNGIELAETVRIYPNPTRDKIFIQGEWINSGVDVSIKLINTLGQIVDKEIIQNWHADNLFEWNLNDPEPGLYFVQLSTGKNIITKKIQIK